MILSKKKNESGSYTLEACISLVAFLIAIMFVYTQIKAIVCESIMQHAVNSMASEMSTYVYVLNRAGLIMDNKGKLDDADALIEQAGGTVSLVKGNVEKFSDIYKSFENGDHKTATEKIGDMYGDAGSMVDSIKNLIASIKDTDWKKLAKGGTQVVGENVVEMLADVALSDFYRWKLNAYLPVEFDDFCEFYLVDKSSVNFCYSRIFPGENNNSILVTVTYETRPAFNMFPIKRKVVKAACTAAWVDKNTNVLKAKE